MSTEARKEAIAILTDELVVRHVHPAQDAAIELVDKLLETHAIVRRAPRRNVRSSIGRIEGAVPIEAGR